MYQGKRRIIRTAACMGMILAVAIVNGCRHAPTPPQSKAHGFLALGDSYTCGESVEPSQSWPIQLAERMRGDGVDLGQPTIIAKTGWTTDELSAGMDRANLKGTYQLVTLLIGVNSQFRGRSIEQYRKEFISLLKRAIALAGGKPSHVVVLSIPDWGVMPFGKDKNPSAIAKSIDAFNAVNRQETAAVGARYVDVIAESRSAATQPSLVATDGLHPSAKMYSQWAELVIPIAEAAVKSQ